MMAFMQIIRTKIKQYWPMTKSLQTGLLLLTGIAGFISSRCPWSNWQTLLGVFGSLFLAISGSTVLNMWFDRDIDARMKRTCQRPLPSGQVPSQEALLLGIALSGSGVLWALLIDPLFGSIVVAGLFFDVLVYTIWLKRRTAWAIVWGGISGGMPILAGRALGTGQIDWIGLMLMAAILFWIPTHILTFSMRYFDDYQRAGIPTFPSTYGFDITGRIIAISSLLASGAMVLAGLGIGLSVGYLRLMCVLSIGLLFLAINIWIQPTENIKFGLFKYASLYMLSAMLIMAMDVM